MNSGHIRNRTDGVRFVLRVTPKSSRDSVEGWVCGADGDRLLKVRVAAAPQDGKANAALIALLAKTFAVRRDAVSILGGASARIKRVQIDGDAAALSSRLEQIGEAA